MTPFHKATRPHNATTGQHATTTNAFSALRNEDEEEETTITTTTTTNDRQQQPQPQQETQMPNTTHRTKPNQRQRKRRWEAKRCAKGEDVRKDGLAVLETAAGAFTTTSDPGAHKDDDI